MEDNVICDVMLNTGRVFSSMSEKNTVFRERRQDRCLSVHLTLENEGNTVL
jgi:hypothetical protein